MDERRERVVRRWLRRRYLKHYKRRDLTAEDALDLAIEDAEVKFGAGDEWQDIGRIIADLIGQFLKCLDREEDAIEQPT